MTSRAILGYLNQQIGLYNLLFMLALSVLILLWLYTYSVNRFKSVTFYDTKIQFTNIFGQQTSVKADEIKTISSLGIKTKGRLLPVSLYFMDNGRDLSLAVDDWMKQKKQQNKTETTPLDSKRM